jgi:hypothetical protein
VACVLPEVFLHALQHLFHLVENGLEHDFYFRGMEHLFGHLVEQRVTQFDGVGLYLQFQDGFDEQIGEAGVHGIDTLFGCQQLMVQHDAVLFADHHKHKREVGLLARFGHLVSQHCDVGIYCLTASW